MQQNDCVSDCGSDLGHILVGLGFPQRELANMDKQVRTKTPAKDRLNHGYAEDSLSKGLVRLIKVVTIFYFMLPQQSRTTMRQPTDVGPYSHVELTAQCPA